MTFTADLLINVSGFSCSRSDVEEGRVGWCLAELVYSTCSFARRVVPQVRPCDADYQQR